jgi:hypothetical protein
MVMGFADIFYKKPGDGKTELNVISRQIRGIGLLVLASVVMALGTAMCVGGFVEKGNISGSLDF